jgi:alkylation response protein AidB-like acyl-CoA dehydrogenase
LAERSKRPVNLYQYPNSQFLIHRTTTSANYHAPIEDMRFLIDELLDAESSLGSLTPFEEQGVGPDLTSALLDEAARLAGDVLAPLRRAGDLRSATCRDGQVTVSPGYDAAIRQMVDSGWLGITAPVDQASRWLR